MKVKVKLVKLFLCLTKRQTIKACVGVEVQLHTFLSGALDGGEWLVSFTPRLVFLRERALNTYFIGGWVGPRAGPVAVAKR
jgi:hypothetical protein